MAKSNSPKRNLARVLKQKMPALKKLFARDPHVLGVFLFGSQADNTATARSDIDLAVLFDRDLTGDEDLSFQVAVCDTVGVYDKVDIINLNRAAHPFRWRAIAGKLLYERDYARVSDFIEQTLIAQSEYAYFIERFNADYFEGMRQDYAKFRHRANQRAPQNH
ncbi:MAG: nucleotidyltransferase domain-containing protein [Chloroflexi bacterium]|nr:nucleotidyltransferase domain-containing protein [Chloroflexota bacterium]